MHAVWPLDKYGVVLIVKKVFDELAPRYRDRPGGYTRIMKIGFRHGDNAPVVLMELVDHPAPEK